MSKSAVERLAEAILENRVVLEVFYQEYDSHKIDSIGIEVKPREGDETTHPALGDYTG